MHYIKATEEHSVINLGRQGEFGINTVVFDDNGYESATAYVKRQGDSGFYEVALEHHQNTFRWQLAAYDVANAGYGKVQVNYLTANSCEKTASWDTRVFKSLDGNNQPEGYLAGDAIEIDAAEHVINVKFNSEQFTINDENELTLITENDYIRELEERIQALEARFQQ